MLSAGMSRSVCGEVFQLKSGGQISGTVIDRGEHGEYLVRSDRGAQLTLSRRQVARVIEADEFDQQYEQRCHTSPDTVEAHRELAAWCKENRSNKLYKVHLQRILELDPADEAARLSLGYQLHQGRWLTRDEVMAARGMRKYDGEYRTPQDIALRESTKQRERVENDWFQKMRVWVSWLDKRRSAEAVQLISNVKDPRAALGIVKLLDKAKDRRVRDLLTATLAELRSPLAVTTLVDFSLNDPDPEVRLQCLDYLLRFHRPINLEPYVQALNDRKYSNDIINRAAVALSRIGNPTAISPLIDALVTTHSFKNVNATAGNINPTFGNGPGASGGGLSMGGQKNKTIRKDIRNFKVRQALIDLSGGQDFEFNEQTWRRWFVKTQTAQYVDARRDQ